MTPFPWAAFTELMGGPSTKRAAFPIQLLKVWSDKLGQYNEPIGERVLGVQHDTVLAVSRIRWKIRERK